MDRRTFLATSAAAATALAGCSGGGGGGGDTPTETATPTETPTATESGDGGGGDGGTGGGTNKTTFTILNFKFAPDVLSVEPGTEVTWKNEDVVEHSVVAGSFSDSAASWEFKSDKLAKGDTATHTFPEAGIYHFKCGVHGKSTGCGAALVGKSTLPSGELPCTDANYE